MKSRVLQTFRNPRWLACYISFTLMPVSYLGIRLCAYLDTRFPVDYVHPGDWSFFGHFDGIAALCYLLFCSLGCFAAGFVFSDF